MVTLTTTKTGKNKTTVRRNGVPRVEAALVTVSPRMAKQWLDDHNTQNRKISRRVVKTYADDILAGNWRLNGQTIIIDEHGDLLDGQHRLAAIVEANKEIQTFVVAGASRSIIGTIDAGKPRAYSDLLTFNGYTNTNELAAFVRAWAAYKSGHYLNNDKISHAAADQFLLQHEEVITASMSDITASNCPLRLSRKIMRMIYCEIVEAGGDLELFDDFHEQFRFGGVSPNNPAMVLRALHERWLTMSKPPSQKTREAITIKAWNNHVLGKQPKTLRWDRFSTRAEAFPVIITSA